MLKKMIEKEYEDGYNYCGIHKDGKGMNFCICDEKKSQDSIFIRTDETGNGTYKVHLEAEEYNRNGHGADARNSGKVYLEMYSGSKLDIEALFRRLTEEYEQGSEIHYQRVLEEFPAFVNPYKVSNVNPYKVFGTIENTSSFSELKECDNLDLKLINEADYDGILEENYFKDENMASYFCWFHNNEWEEKSKEIIFPEPKPKYIYEYEDSSKYKFGINKMKIEMAGSQIKLNDMTPEEMVKKGDFGYHDFKYDNIGSAEELDRACQKFYEEIGGKLNCSPKIREKITGAFEKAFNDIKNKMLKKENKKR